jgi:hypothetical protein
MRILTRIKMPFFFNRNNYLDIGFTTLYMKMLPHLSHLLALQPLLILSLLPHNPRSISPNYDKKDVYIDGTCYIGSWWPYAITVFDII